MAMTCNLRRSGIDDTIKYVYAMSYRDRAKLITLSSAAFETLALPFDLDIQFSDMRLWQTTGNVEQDFESIRSTMIEQLELLREAYEESNARGFTTVQINHLLTIAALLNPIHKLTRARPYNK